MPILVNRRVAAVAVAALLGLLAALPAAPAGAASGSVVKPLTTPAGATYTASWLSSEEVTSLLGGLPLNELPIGSGLGEISPEALLKALEALPVFNALGGDELEALKKAINGLGSGGTLEILKDPSSLTSGLTQTLEKLLGLGGLLGGKNSGEIAKQLEEALEHVNVGELLSQLLGSSQSPEAIALLEKLLKLLPIEPILHEGLGSSPVSPQTLEELAKELGMSSEELVKELGSTGEAVTGELANGKLITVLNGTGELVVGTLDKVLGGETGKEAGKETTETKETSTEEETVKETGTSKDTGAGTDNGISPGGAGGTQVTVNFPGKGVSAAVKKATKKTVGKIVVLKHSVHASVAKIVVRTPGAGRITANNRDIRTVSRRVGRARRLTFEVVLSKAGIASLTRGKRTHTLRLRIVFVPTHGLRSHAILKLRFR